jgi:hypothetical protein
LYFYYDPTVESEKTCILQAIGPVDRLGANFEDERESLVSSRKMQTMPLGTAVGTKKIKVTQHWCKMLTIRGENNLVHIRKELSAASLHALPYCG